MDWDKVSPVEVTLNELRTAKDEDFPHTYSGEAWHAAAKILHALDGDLDAIRTLDPWHLDPRADKAIEGMDLTGFMVGWACSALRQMHGASPGKSGAVVVLGEGVADSPRMIGPAEGELHKALS